MDGEGGGKAGRPRSGGRRFVGQGCPAPRARSHHAAREWVRDEKKGQAGNCHLTQRESIYQEARGEKGARPPPPLLLGGRKRGASALANLHTGELVPRDVAALQPPLGADVRNEHARLLRTADPEVKSPEGGSRERGIRARLFGGGERWRRGGAATEGGRRPP